MGLVESLRAVLRRLGVSAEEDEFDPFAGRDLDPPPGEEGDDRMHEIERNG